MATGHEPIRIGTQPPFAVPPERRDPARRLCGRLVAPVTVWTAGHPPAEAGPAAAARGRVINPIRVVAVNGRTRYRGLAEVHVLLRNPQVELVPCRRRHHGPGVADTSEMMEGGTST
jgi:hypothetical protein